MAFNSNITPGSPPLLWSNLDEAFSRINENFDILVATIGDGSGLIPINFETLDTNVSPAANNTYSLGSATNKWRNVYTEGWSEIGLNQLNGLWAGASHIKGYFENARNIIELPEGSKVGNDLIIDPNKTFFKSAQVDNGDRVEANEFNDTLNFLSGDGIAMTVGSPGESITISNDGIIDIVSNPGTGISVTKLSGVATIGNSGVISLQNTGSLPPGRSLGAGIFIDSTSGSNIKITNTGILGFDNSGFGTNISVDPATGLATVNLSTGVVTTAAFRNIVITGTTGQPTVDADIPADTLTLNAGYGIIINSSNDPEIISFSVSSDIDIKGSVFASDSGIMVDSVDRKFYGDLIGNVTGTVTGSASVAATVDITDTNGLTTVYYPTFIENRSTGQVLRSDVDLSYRTDTNTLTAGTFSGNLNGTANIATTVTLVATNSTAATHFITFVDTATGNENVRTDTDLTYNPSTNTLTAGTFATGSLTISGSTIGTTDSSGIIVNELTTFNTDVTFENDITVAERLTLKGSRVINLAELKSIVAASTSFANFQTRIAALV